MDFSSSGRFQQVPDFVIVTWVQKRDQITTATGTTTKLTSLSPELFFVLIFLHRICNVHVTLIMVMVVTIPIGRRKKNTKFEERDEPEVKDSLIISQLTSRAYGHLACWFTIHIAHLDPKGSELCL